MHRFFTVEDLMHELCAHLSPLDLAVMACVSSLWFHHAILRLYKNISVENALAPMGQLARRHDDTEYYYFVKSPGLRQLERFAQYAPHVRILRIHPDHHIALLEATSKAQLNGVNHLFPNTRSLHWTARTYLEFDSLARILIPPDIDCLHLSIQDYRPTFLKGIGQLLTNHLSHLCFLRIDDACRNNASVPQTIALMRPMQKILDRFAPTLKSVHIPVFYDTRYIVKCLAKIPSLCNLTIGKVLHDNDNTLNMDSNAIYNRLGCFTSLGTFSFNGPLHSLHERFLNPFDLSSLTTLSWHFDVTPQDVRVFITTVVTTCPRLKSLAIGVPKTYGVRKHIVEWDSIRPIINCKELTSLSFNAFEICVTVDELSEFLRSKATWKRLDIFTSQALGVQVLFLFAKHCPNLVHLGVSLSTSVVSPMITSLVPLLGHHCAQFKSLMSIDFGTSNLGLKCSVHKIGIFLYRICEKPLKVNGHDEFYYHRISRVVASCHLEEETRSGRPLPMEIKERAEQISRDIWPAEHGFHYHSDNNEIGEDEGR